MALCINYCPSSVGSGYNNLFPPLSSYMSHFVTFISFCLCLEVLSDFYSVLHTCNNWTFYLIFAVKYTGHFTFSAYFLSCILPTGIFCSFCYDRVGIFTNFSLFSFNHIINRLSHFCYIVSFFANPSFLFFKWKYIVLKIKYTKLDIDPILFANSPKCLHAVVI